MNAMVPDSQLPTSLERVPTLSAMPIHLVLTSREPPAKNLTRKDVPALRAYIAEGERLAVPASRDQLEQLCHRLELQYPVPEFSDSQKADRRDEFCNLLSLVPPDILEASARGWMLSAERTFPTAGLLLGIVGGREHWGLTRGTYLRRARQALAILETLVEA